jgi:hypothetical protein
MDNYHQHPDDCIPLVQENCPNATIANFDDGTCWCQYGNDMTEIPGEGMYACLLSTISNICSKLSHK